jgi:hypothetical protein
VAARGERAVDLEAWSYGALPHVSALLRSAHAGLAYGWTEAGSHAGAPARRARYLELIGARAMAL